MAIDARLLWAHCGGGGGGCAEPAHARVLHPGWSLRATHGLCALPLCSLSWFYFKNHSGGDVIITRKWRLSGAGFLATGSLQVNARLHSHNQRLRDVGMPVIPIAVLVCGVFLLGGCFCCL